MFLSYNNTHIPEPTSNTQSNLLKVKDEQERHSVPQEFTLLRNVGPMQKTKRKAVKRQEGMQWSYFPSCIDLKKF